MTSVRSVTVLFKPKLISVLAPMLSIGNRTCWYSEKKISVKGHLIGFGRSKMRLTGSFLPVT